MARVVIIGGSKGLGAAIAEIAQKEIPEVLPISRHTSPGLDLSRLDTLETETDALIPHLADMEYLFLTAGVGYQGDLAEQESASINAVVDTVITGPLHFLSQLLQSRQAPCHLITITSTTSAKVRSNETTYGAAKAGQAQLARNLHQELRRVLPGSKSTLVHPGGMQTPFWDNTGVDTSAYLDPSAVASIVWREVRSQSLDWLEFSIIRDEGSAQIVPGTPAVQFPI